MFAYFHIGLLSNDMVIVTCFVRGAQWPGGQCFGLRIQRSGVLAPLGSNRVVSLSKSHLLPKRYQEAVAPSQHD